MQQWEDAVARAFVPTRTILGVEEKFCEVGCRLLRATAYALDSGVKYPKGAFEARVRKDLSNATTLHVDAEGAIVRTTGVCLVPRPVAPAAAVADGAGAAETGDATMGDAGGASPVAGDTARITHAPAPAMEMPDDWTTTPESRGFDSHSPDSASKHCPVRPSRCPSTHTVT